MRHLITTLTLALTLGLALAQPSPWGVAISFADSLDAVMFDCADLFEPDREPACFVTDADSPTVRAAINDSVNSAYDAAFFGPWLELEAATERERQFPAVTRFVMHDSGRAYGIIVSVDLSSMLTSVYVFWLEP